MNDETISFVSPYLSGRQMMRIHLTSIRKFCPSAPILVSKKGGEPDEMEAHRAEFGIRYWMEDCSYVDALLRLLQRCETQYVCIVDHDTVLLSNPNHYFQGLAEERWDLVGIEERVREPPGTDWRQLAPQYNGWMRFAPGYMDATFLMFNLRDFRHKWGLRGIKGRRPRGSLECEYHYGICEKLKRHKYLLPYHTQKYGMGNLVKDGEIPVLWHQWYGSYRARLGGTQFEPTIRGTNETIAIVRRGEEAFLADYPNLDFSNLIPAWGPDCDIRQERLAVANSYPTLAARGLDRIRRWKSYGPRDLVHRLLLRIERWRRLHSN